MMLHPSSSGPAHLAAIWVDVPAGEAFAALSSAEKVGRWSLGSMGFRRADEDGIHVGTSLFDGSETRVRIETHPEQGLIDFHVGKADVLLPRISIRVTSGERIGGQAGQCLVAMTALRTPEGTVEAWSRTCFTHETEILLIKAQLESGAAAA